MVEGFDRKNGFNSTSSSEQVADGTLAEEEKQW